MEITKLGSGAYKVSLQREELSEKGLCYEMLDCRSKETLDFLSEALSEAQRRFQNGNSAFPEALERTYVEIFPDQHGGCYLYFSLKHAACRRKMEKAEDLPVYCGYISQKKSLKTLLRQLIEAPQTLCCFCRAYVLDDGFVLCISPEKQQENSLKALLNEFSVPLLFEKGDYLRLAEYGNEYKEDVL